MSNIKTYTAEDFKDVKYHDLLAKFTELGVPEAFKRGSKKVDLIAKAVERLKIKASLESVGLSKEEVSKEVEKMAIKKAKAEDQKILDQAKQVEKQEKAMVKKIAKAKLTKEQLEYNIKNIRANIAGGVPSQRQILQVKLEALLDLLDKA